DEYLRETKRTIREAERLMKGFSKNRSFRKRLESVYNSAARNSQRVFSAAWVKIFTLPDSFRVDRLEGNCIQSCQPQNWSGVKNELRDANSYIGNQALRVLSVRVPKKLSSKQKRKLSGMRARIRSLIDGYTPFLNQRVPDVACFG
ncbi:MAG: hypothetical protein NZO16_06885, partial [Deltaproteobacteria bacterium]|nr:hypothetical protein [Deltaproteobacteria bacterium]